MPIAPLKNMTATLAFAIAALAAAPALAAEVNVYTSREPALIKPVLDAFTKATGIKVNAVFLTTASRSA